jgi:hypothetical protein
MARPHQACPQRPNGRAWAEITAPPHLPSLSFPALLFGSVAGLLLPPRRKREALPFHRALCSRCCQERGMPRRYQAVMPPKRSAPGPALPSSSLPPPLPRTAVALAVWPGCLLVENRR